jgi:hypothetical protein
MVKRNIKLEQAYISMPENDIKHFTIYCITKTQNCKRKLLTKIINYIAFLNKAWLGVCKYMCVFGAAL